MSARTDVILQLTTTFALVLWAGATWCVGYILVPVLFNSYEREQAGDIAQRLFHVIHVLSLSCAMVVLLDYRIRFSKVLQHQRGLWVVLLLVFGVIIQYVGLTPLMEKAKLANDWIRFGRLHGASQLIYLVHSLGLVYLVYERFAVHQYSKYNQSSK